MKFVSLKAWCEYCNTWIHGECGEASDEGSLYFVQTCNHYKTIVTMEHIEGGNYEAGGVLG